MAKTKDKILIADSDREKAQELSDELEKAGYCVLLANELRSALEMVSSHCPELVILQSRNRENDCNTFIRCVRVWSALPIIVVSNNSDAKTKAETLDFGADDFLVRPVETIEMLARIRTAFRHTLTVLEREKLAVESCFNVRGLRVDYLSHKVFVNERDTHLTPNEFRIVCCLAKHPGEVLSYRRIVHELWGPSAATDNKILRVHMSNIRRKIESHPENPSYLITEAGVGYMLTDR